MKKSYIASDFKVNQTAGGHDRYADVDCGGLVNFVPFVFFSEHKSTKKYEKHLKVFENAYIMSLVRKQLTTSKEGFVFPLGFDRSNLNSEQELTENKPSAP